ncbi:MAG: tRNA-(ms[2]io[6]A)-hydroxylase [Cyanobacteriota bacterium]|nr:tRNA-(ms[2]io[6]A)-hydroxylase [Cyanobacteriota bacterium]
MGHGRVSGITLASQTQAAWIEQAVGHIDIILIDHANCEKKAAGNALSLLFRYPEYPSLNAALSPLAREELQHFEKVNRHLERLGIPMKRLTPAPYASQLAKQMKRQEPDYLLDSLLTAAVIEARSHERLSLLGIHCLDAELRDFYAWLSVAEERHLRLYLDLALEYFSGQQVEQRLAEWLTFEAGILEHLYSQPRVHS